MILVVLARQEVFCSLYVCIVLAICSASLDFSSPQGAGWNQVEPDSSQIIVIVRFGTWVPGLVEPGFQNLGFRTQVRTTFIGGKVVRTQVEQLNWF